MSINLVNTKIQYLQTLPSLFYISQQTLNMYSHLFYVLLTDHDSISGPEAVVIHPTSLVYHGLIFLTSLSTRDKPKFEL